MIPRAMSRVTPDAPTDTPSGTTPSTTEVGGRRVVDAEFTEGAMRAWALGFARALPAGSVVALHGPLGAGKTSLARMLCEALGVGDLSQVTSPTFALVHEYTGTHGVIVHADLYRLRRPEELEQLGWDDLLARAALTIIEWPAQGGSFVPRTAIHVHLDHVPGRPEVRRVVCAP